MPSGTVVDRTSGATAPRVASTVGVRHVSKVFGGHVALSDVSFDLVPGSVLALVGENGAGKSTCVKILGGVYQPDGGEVVVDGRPTTLHHPTDSSRHGIAVVHQHPGLFPDLSIAENMFLGNLPTLSLGRIDHQLMRRRANEILPALGLRRPVDEPAVIVDEPQDVARPQCELEVVGRDDDGDAGVAREPPQQAGEVDAAR